MNWKPTVICFLVLYSSVSNAQEYFPLVDTSSVWMEGVGYDGGAPPYGDIEQYTIKTDTIINGLSYKKLYLQSQNYYTHYYYGTEWIEYGYISDPLFQNKFLRDDIEEKKVFMLDCTPYDSTEILLYDFDLQIGDTLLFGNMWQENVVIMIDSVEIGSFYRKRFHIATASDTTQSYVTLIEGIGSSFGLIAQLEPPFESFENLVCFTNNGETTVNFYEGVPYPADTNARCDFPEPTIEILSNQIKPINLFPNPVSDVLFMDIPSNITKGQIKIYNSTKQLQSEYFCNPCSSNSLSIDEFTPGIYYLVFINENQTYFGKFVKL